MDSRRFRGLGGRGRVAFGLFMGFAMLPSPSVVAWAQPASNAPREPIVHPYEAVSGSLRAMVQPLPLVLYGGAALSTPALVAFADRSVQDFFQREDPLTNSFGVTSLWAGGSVPILLPLGLYAGGLLGNAGELATAGAAAIQAGVLQLLAVQILKWMTDRAGPYPDGDPNERRWHASLLRDSSDPAHFNFNPFDLKWGLRFPSGHASANVAVVAALSAFYSDAWWIPASGYPLALAIGVGMIEGDYHWLSDVVAGALIGQAIGWSVGRHFREVFDARKHGQRPALRYLQVYPRVGIGTLGVLVSGRR